MHLHLVFSTERVAVLFDVSNGISSDINVLTQLPKDQQQQINKTCGSCIYL